jgi:hypothetical protein
MPATSEIQSKTSRQLLLLDIYCIYETSKCRYNSSLYEVLYCNIVKWKIETTEYQEMGVKKRKDAKQNAWSLTNAKNSE